MFWRVSPSVVKAIIVELLFTPNANAAYKDYLALILKLFKYFGFVKPL